MAKKMGMQQQPHSSTPLGLTLMMIIVVIGVGVAAAAAADDDSKKDREECAEQLAGLATCLPYVGGNAKAPTPDCCTGLKQVLKNSDKCLCVVIRDRNDPDLGLNINLTLALGLPSVCHAPANISKCPELLHLPPNSPDAQVFYQFGKSSNSSGAPAPASSAATSSAAGTSSARQQQQQQSSGSGGWNGRGGYCWLELQLLCVGGILLWCLSSSSSAYHLSQLSFM